MIYTITFNPSIDYVLKVKELKKNKINKSEKQLIFPGGKGINVSIVLKNLEIENKALGFIAGFTGNEIERLLQNLGIKTSFIKLEKGNSRINVKVNSNSEETAVNCIGPKIEKDNIYELFKKLDELQNDDILVIGGSVPIGIENNIYERICKRLENKKIKIIVDTTCNLLKNVLKYKPFLIKPNNEELGEIFNVEIKNKKEALFYAKKLKKQGAQNVIVSLGEEGAVMVDTNNNEYYIKAPIGKRVSTVGSGDSMVAGFIAGIIKFDDYKKALELGVACGSATACTEFLASKKEISTFLKMVK